MYPVQNQMYPGAIQYPVQYGAQNQMYIQEGADTRVVHHIPEEARGPIIHHADKKGHFSYPILALLQVKSGDICSCPCQMQERELDLQNHIVKEGYDLEARGGPPTNPPGTIPGELPPPGQGGPIPEIEEGGGFLQKSSRRQHVLNSGKILSSRFLG